MANDGPLRQLARYWDGVVGAWLDGAPAVPPPLRRWFESYRGRGVGAVDTQALPELWHGSLDARKAAVVFLALNPGRVYPKFQHRDGVFAEEIREQYGSYTDWAASWPYLREPWHSEIGRNRHHQDRLTFARRWFDDPSLPTTAMVSFEMYPWHSKSLKAPLRPDPGIVREYIWRPVAALGVPVFAFGKDWHPLLEEGLRLPVIDRLGVGGRDYGSAAATRAVTVFEAPDDVRVIAVNQASYAVPPSASETTILREALRRSD